MKRKFFLDSLLRRLISIMIPILILGTLAIVLANNNIKTQIETNNMYNLFQVQETFDSMFMDLKNINIGISTNPMILSRLKGVLNNPNAYMSMEDNMMLNTVVGMITAKLASNPIAHSAYIYFENSTGSFVEPIYRVADIEDYFDTEWYLQYREMGTADFIWTAPRAVKQYSFERDGSAVVSIIQRIYAQPGVVVANFSVGHIKRMLSEMSTKPQQGLLIADQNQQILFFSELVADIGEEAMLPVMQTLEDAQTHTVIIGQRSYVIAKSFSPKTQLSYISIIPAAQLYSLQKQITILTIVLLVLSFFFAMLVAYRTAQKNYASLSDILNLLEAAVNEKALPPQNENNPRDDIYGTIISNIIRTFVQNDLVKVQLLEKKYQNQVLELVALQAQMNPHFLYNTLGTIYWKVMGLSGTPNEITELIENLSEMLRYSLHNTFETVPLHEEMSNAKNYIGIQRVRFEERVTVFWQVPEECSQCQIPKMILQPIIENCFLHGLNELDFISVRIKAFISDEQLNLIITDSGVGISRARLAEIRAAIVSNETPNNHIGILNTSKRIALSYLGKGSLKIYSKENVGTSVHVCIPL